MDIEKENNEKKETAATPVIPTFTKEQLVKSEKYAMHRDVLSALLKDDASYTFQEVDKILRSFLKRKVKK